MSDTQFVSDLPPLPPPAPTAYLCFTILDQNREWRLINSLFDLRRGLVVTCHLNFRGTHTVWDVGIDTWAGFKDAVVTRPDLRRALGSVGQFIVFGKHNLVAPCLYEFLRGSTFMLQDVIDVKFPGMYPTAENRSAFTKSFCEWLTGVFIVSPIDLLQC